MKVNDRTLLHIAQSKDNLIDQSGWLSMYNDERRVFQRRFCVLKENLFFYYQNQGDREPLGVIILEGYQVEIVDGLASEGFTFKVDFGNSELGLNLKQYVFAAESHDDMER